LYVNVLSSMKTMPALPGATSSAQPPSSVGPRPPLWMCSFGAASETNSLWSIRPAALPQVDSSVSPSWRKTLWSIRNGALDPEPPVTTAPS
jgi:hypothetical protein